MAKVLFSSWNGRVLDGRGRDPEGLPEWADLELPSQVEGKEIKGLVGWSGLVVADAELDVVRALKAYFERVQHESCGRCIPCRIGSYAIVRRLEKLLAGEAGPEDLSVLERLARLMRDSSLCELGQSSPLPLLDALRYFNEAFTACFNGKKEPDPRKDCYHHALMTTPCRNGCPAHIPIHAYIGCITEGFYEESLAVIRDKTPLAGVLGRVCVHPCETECRRRLVDEALAIRLLKRFVADHARRTATMVSPAAPAVLNGDRVAVIGSGPAGLNAAYQLARKGYAVTIFEALPVAGGMLAVGIPSYRLPREILNAEIDLVRSLGVEIKLNTRIGVDLPFNQLKKEGFKAIFIATGLHLSSAMGVAGEDEGYCGFIPGVEFLRRVNLGQEQELGRKVAVIGGGNVAMDCARSSLRLGIEEVNLVYRRSRTEMPANDAEIVAAEEEGVRFHLLANPSRIIAQKGRVVGMECIRMKLGEPDASGRRRPVPIEGSEFMMELDMIIPAIGQVADVSFLGEDSGVSVTNRGIIEADPLTMVCTVPGVFAGGDAVLGARTVIEAIATGNRAAEAIDRYLQTGQVAITTEMILENLIEKIGVDNPDEKPPMVGGQKRQEEEVLPVEKRLEGFDEADLGFRGPREAVREAERCAYCNRLTMVIT